MKKILILAILALSFNATGVFAGNEVITSEDFESYSTETVYNSGELIVSYPGMADATLTGAYIINAPGGIYEGSDAYEGNAAENIVTYAQTSDTTAIAVAGGLGNGWRGLYSHPMLFLEGGQGAASEYNAANRRLSVVQNGSDKVLKFGPASNAYVATGSWYGYDGIDFSKPVIWESDVNIQLVKEGYFELSLTNGKFSDTKLFEYASHLSGRKSINPIVTFNGDGKILVMGTETADYTEKTFYTVSLFVDRTADTPVYRLSIKERETETEIVSSELDFDEFDFSGVDYYAYTPKGATKPTEAFVDNIRVEKVVFDAEITSTALVNINGKGRSLVTFSDVFIEETVNTDNIKVYCPDGTQLEGVTLQIQKNKQSVIVIYPELEPSSVYRLVIKGVISQNNIAADCERSFTTSDIASFSSAAKTQTGVSFGVKNNSNYETSVTVIAAGFKDGKIVSGGVYYKKVTIAGGKTVNDEFTEMEFTETPDEIRIYAVDNIHEFNALIPQKSVK